MFRKNPRVDDLAITYFTILDSTLESHDLVLYINRIPLFQEY